MYSYQYFPSFDLATTTCDYYSGINSPIILVLVIYTRASNSPSIQVLVLVIVLLRKKTRTYVTCEMFHTMVLVRLIYVETTAEYCCT